MATTNRLGELLVREKLISLQQLKQAQEEQRRNNTSLGYALAKMGFISDKEITDFLSQQYRVQAIDLNEYEIDEEAIHTESPDMFFVYVLAPTAEGLDKLNDAIRERAKTNPLAGPAFGSMVDFTPHRDQLLRSNATYK